MSWLRKSFLAPIEDFDLPLREFQQLIDISAEKNLKNTLKSANLFQYWPLLRSAYPEIAKHPVQQLLLFVST